MASRFPPPYVLEPLTPKSHTHTVILLHGRGSNGHDFAEELMESESSSGQNLRQHFPGFKWVFPTAPSRYSTAFQEEMNEWFDIRSLDDPAEDEESQVEGLKTSIEYVRRLLDQEAQVVGSSNRMILAGISQGAAVGVHVLLSYSSRIGAFVGWSGWLPFQTQLSGSTSRVSGSDGLHEFYQTYLGVQCAASPPAQAWRTPTLLCHSADDDAVNIRLGREVRRVMEKIGVRVVWKEYASGGHWINEPQGLDDMFKFFNDNIQRM